MDPSDLPLRDIHLPDAISWWPLAWGWWVLAVLVLAVLFLLITRYQRRHRDPLAGLKVQLADAEQSFSQNGDSRALAADLSRLLRLATLRLGARTEVAAATGDRWLKVLDSFLPTDCDSLFDTEVGQLFTVVPYQSKPDQDAERLLSVAKRWFAQARPQHKVAA